MYLALRKCKNNCKKIKIILVPDFCPLKPEIARFSIEFRLNSSPALNLLTALSESGQNNHGLYKLVMV